MAVVHIPAHWRDRTGGHATVEVPGGVLRDVVRALEEAYPGVRALLLDDVTGEVRGEIAIAINSEVTENGLLEPVPPDAEIYLVPAISGG
ncbi:MAG: molybdopterin synthase sulfur carrier subunit [Dehalococcoidia bacterium]|nr:molybdopterin synthase sulfur carrier subunit [Dehalococcoidia bacterium]